MTKEEARKYILRERKKCDFFRASIFLKKEIKKLGLIHSGQKVGIYYPLKNEIDVMFLVREYPETMFYLPRVHQEILEFCAYQSGDKLIDGPYHTKEPLGVAFPTECLDLILIPCVGMNQQHQRLGYGKGYYDKTLACYQGLKVGICLKEYQNLDIKMQDYDLKLDQWI